MAAFRILNQFPVYFDLAGNLADGGELRFYESGTTFPKSVYGGPGLTPDNGSTVPIGSDGRPELDIWGDGAYRVRLYDADDTLIAEADDVEIPGGDATTIPALVDGYFLSNNGSLLLWATFLQLPDPTGQDGKMVVADGAGYILVPQPTTPVIPDPEIVVTANSFQGGTSEDETKFLHQWGNGTASASGSHRTSATVTFATAYASPPEVFPVIKQTQICAAGLIGAVSVTDITTTGCTVQIDVNDDDDRSQFNILSSVAFGWHAVGTREVPAA